MSSKYDSAQACFLIEQHLHPENAKVNQLLMQRDPEDVAPGRDTSQNSPFGAAPGGPVKSISTPVLTDINSTFSIMPSITEAAQSLQALQANLNEAGQNFHDLQFQNLSISPPQAAETSRSPTHMNSAFATPASMSDRSQTPATVQPAGMQGTSSSGPAQVSESTTAQMNASNLYSQNPTISVPSSLPPLLQSYLAAATNLSPSIQSSAAPTTLSLPQMSPLSTADTQQQASPQSVQMANIGSSMGADSMGANMASSMGANIAGNMGGNMGSSLEGSMGGSTMGGNMGGMYTPQSLTIPQMQSLAESLYSHPLAASGQLYGNLPSSHSGSSASTVSLSPAEGFTAGAPSGHFLVTHPMASANMAGVGGPATIRVSPAMTAPFVPPPVVPPTPTPNRSTTPTPTPSTPTATRIKLLLSSGGQFLKNGTGQWEYFGGETRLVTVSHTSSCEELMQDLSKANKTVLDERCQIKYALPGCTDVLIDLINDDDVDNMWDEWQTFTLTDKPTFKLHLYVQMGTDRSRSSSDQYSDHASHRSTGSSAGSDAEGAGGTPNTASTTKTYRSVTSEDLAIEGSITKDPKINLLELEGKIELISPEDLMIVRFLGAGGYGEVYLCRWHSSDVAVKCLNPSLFSANGGLGNVSEDVVAELVKEANMLGGLRHPNVVWVYGLVLPTGEVIDRLKDRLEPGETIDAINLAASAANAAGMVPGVIRPPALVTEYLSGGSLHDAIRRGEAYLNSKTIKIKLMLDTARGMEYLHSKRIVHFDLKSGNLLVGFNNRTPMCKVADFGLSKQRQQTYVTGVTSMRGTLPWTAPEIIKTPTAVSDKVDVYSFGIVMWELWTLKEPFDGVNYHALLHMMSQQDGLRPALPGTPEWDLGELEPPVEGWLDLMQRCWAEDPQERPTFVEVVQELSKMLIAARSVRRAAAA